MASIVVSGDTSGAVTITAPAIAGTTTLTLPTTSGTIVTTGGAASLTTSGNLTFTGTGNRITGDFSNATIANRVLFQTSTTNASTIISAIPNGTGVAGQFAAYNNSDPANAGTLVLSALSADARISTGLTGTGTYLPLTMYTGGSERLRIDTSGNVGIGTTPSFLFDTYNSSTAVDYIAGRFWSAAAASGESRTWLKIEKASSYGGAIGGYLSQGVGSGLIFGTQNNASTPTERMRIDSSGNVGIGTTSPTAKLEVNGNILLNGGSNTLYTTAADLVIQSGTSGLIRFANNNGSNERMRITSGGDVQIGTTVTYYNASRLTSLTSTASNAAGVFATSVGGDVGQAAVFIGKFDNNTTTSQIFVKFLANNAGTAMGQINGNGAGAAAFGNWSDARLKENIEDLPSQLENICLLRPVEFDYKTGGHQIGFIAQEMQQVYPDVVGEDSEGMLTVTGWSKTEARLVKAIQELNAKVEAQAAEIAALKGVK